jgi:hypothetical protein
MKLCRGDAEVISVVRAILQSESSSSSTTYQFVPMRWRKIEERKSIVLDFTNVRNELLALKKEMCGAYREDKVDTYYPHNVQIIQVDSEEVVVPNPVYSPHSANYLEVEVFMTWPLSVEKVNTVRTGRESGPAETTFSVLKNSLIPQKMKTFLEYAQTRSVDMTKQAQAMLSEQQRKINQRVANKPHPTGKRKVSSLPAVIEATMLEVAAEGYVHSVPTAIDCGDIWGKVKLTADQREVCTWILQFYNHGKTYNLFSTHADAVTWLKAKAKADEKMEEELRLSASTFGKMLKSEGCIANKRGIAFLLRLKESTVAAHHETLRITASSTLKRKASELETSPSDINVDTSVETVTNAEGTVGTNGRSNKKTCAYL